MKLEQQLRLLPGYLHQRGELTYQTCTCTRNYSKKSRVYMGVLTTVSRAREDVQVYENSGQPLDRVTFLPN